MIRVGVKSITFSSGSSAPLSPPPRGVTVIVGPNNAGKSVLLDEMFRAMVNLRSWHGGKWVAGVEVRRSATEEQFQNWFEANARVHPNGYLALWSDGDEINALDYDSAYVQWQLGHGPSQIFRSVGYFGTDSRFHMLGDSQRPEARSRSLDPLQQVWMSKETELRLSDLTEAAFGFPVCIDHHKNYFGLLMGAPSVVDEGFTPPREVLERYDSMVGVSTQGDGIRAFAGILLNAIATNQSTLFVDEPEAFLHPPQARLMGRYLVDETPSEGQVFIATHSADVLQGILDARTGRDVAILRLDVAQTDGGAVRIRHELESGPLRELWRDSLVRYSGILSGLFHKGVIVCEGDGDARYYSATLDLHLSGKREHDLTFTHVGGKSSMPKAIKALQSVGVRSLAIIDIDLLNNSANVKAVVEAAGGDFMPLRDDLAIIQRYVQKGDGGPMVRDLKEAVKGVTSRKDSSFVTDREAEVIVDAVKRKSGWRIVKENGIRSFRDEAYQAVMRVRAELLKVGIILVPVGELESWHPEVSAPHGRAFVTAVFEEGAHLVPNGARDAFMDEIVDYFGLEK